ncbi:MAG: ATP-binding cassette domain-containing protein [Bryobacterales bacterium]|nr:ATP-binding cassette domain-containing protein [Bryobacterales bacterium]
MIEARIGKRFPAGEESAAFSLDIELEASAGVTVLFGPSGAGKTLTLDCIAGFVRPDSGRILLDDQILYDGATQVHLRPQLRRCGYVFQNYALFPHMSLRANLAFAAERLPRLERHRKVNEMLERFHLAGVAGRKPREVSGGEKQRCSIARALIAGPRLLLLDEPARGLDAPLRADLYAVLRQVRQEFHIPILLVTHDLEECFELGDQMLVIREGRAVQGGSPRAVIDHPASVEVARLLGIVNLFEAEILALDPGRNTSRLRMRDCELAGPYYSGRLKGDRVWVFARPEELRAVPNQGGRPAPNQVAARLARVSERPQGVRLEFAGDLFVDVPRTEFSARKDNKEWLVEFPPQAIRIV